MSRPFQLPRGRWIEYLDSRPVGHAAAAWSVKSGTGTLGDGEWTFGGTTVLVSALPYLKLQDAIKIAWTYNRGGAGTVVLSLKRRKNDASAPAETVDTISDTTGGATETTVETLGGFGHLVDNTFSYWLEVSMPASATFYNAVVSLNT